MVADQQQFSEYISNNLQSTGWLLVQELSLKNLEMWLFFPEFDRNTV